MNEQKNFLKKCPTVEKTTDQGKLIQFKLQLSLGTTAISISKITNISNTHVSSAFSSYAKGSIVLQSFVETGKLTEQNNLQKIVQKGYEINQEGAIFDVGYNRQVDVRTSKEYSFIMCKIAVGKSYCYPEKKYKEKKIEMPEGFESVYLYNEEQNQQGFLHKYIIFKNYQVFPCYLIQFTIEPFKQQQTIYCGNCNKVPPNIAKYYCIQEDANFCGDCDNQCHQSKVGGRHTRPEISERPKKFGKCITHQENMELYCNVCYNALCVQCKINGDHMNGQMATHQLVRLNKAYADISGKVKDIDPNIERRKNQLTQDLSKIDMKIKQVNNKAIFVEQQILAVFTQALDELQYETQKKLSFLIGDQLELKRQYDHIEWMESFLKYSLEVQEPHQFLHSWYKYSKYKKQILSLANLSINTEVKADMKLEGTLHVVVESKKKRNNESSIPIMNTALKQQTIGYNFEQTPFKSIQSSMQRDIGSTQLRRTVFLKHFTEGGKNIGELNLMKNNQDSRVSFPSDLK